MHAFRVCVEIKFRLRSYVTLCFKYIYENSNSEQNDLLLLQSTQWNAFAYRMGDIFCFVLYANVSLSRLIYNMVGEPYDLKTTHNPRISYMISF